MEKITMDDLATQSIEMLPARETLWLNININVAPVTAVNTAIAVNAATFNSTATANAWQWALAYQS